MTIKKVVVALAVVLSCYGAVAQRGPNKSPEEMAQQQTSLMDERLSLSQDQKLLVSEINLKYVRKMREAKMARDMSQSTQLENEKDNELKSILTPEQYKTWLDLKQDLQDSGRKQKTRNK